MRLPSRVPHPSLVLAWVGIFRPNHRIPYLPQLPRDLLVLHLQIRNRRLASRTPVHNVLPAIDQPFLIQPHKHFAHRARQAFIHREVLAPPIHRGAQPLHLIENGAAIFAFPFPNSLYELFAPQVATSLAFLRQLALDHHLRGDAGMIRPRQPQRDEPAHAVPAHQNVHLRLVEHVPHVQPPGDVRRRQEQREHRSDL